MADAWSIGYQGHTLPSFLDALHRAGIACVADVRENPVSRKPGFSKRRLAKALEEAGIQYVHLPELGAPRVLRHALAAHHEMARFLHGYRRHLRGQGPALQRLRDLVQQRTTAILCFEADEAQCHRQEIARWLEAAGTRVVQLRPEDRSVDRSGVRRAGRAKR